MAGLFLFSRRWDRETRCPCVCEVAKWGKSSGARDTRAQMVWQSMSRKPGSAWVNLRERQSTSRPQPSARVPLSHWTTRASPWTMCWPFARSHNHGHDHRSVKAHICGQSHTYMQTSLSGTHLHTYMLFLCNKWIHGNHMWWDFLYMLVCVLCQITHSSWFSQCCVDTGCRRRHPAANHRS